LINAEFIQHAFAVILGEIFVIVELFEYHYGKETSFTWTNPNDSTDYTVRFLSGTLVEEEIDYEIYNIRLQLVEVV